MNVGGGAGGIAGDRGPAKPLKHGKMDELVCTKAVAVSPPTN